MGHNTVVFIAYEERQNLGIRYMAAVLSEAGHKVKVMDFRKDKAVILKKLRQWHPLLIGFSVIFENHIYDFRKLIKYLRNKGIECHFTAGGHFASLRPADLFEIIPDLDSIVRFEGEHTLLDLVNQLYYDSDWKKVMGLSFMSDGILVKNQLRSLEPDLDNFPIPIRAKLEEYLLERKYSTLLAGRGCIQDCNFCNTREFYRHPPGPIKRIRNPKKVVAEMEFLHKEHDCSVFLFQDDDFPVITKQKSDWISNFCKALRDKDLSGKIMWKINCRSDEVDPAVFKLMKQHGLFRVFLGIEDGTDSGLLQMNKRIKVEDNIRAVNILKKLGVSIDYGFMLIHPYSTFHSMNKNINFLKLICENGYMPVKFMKMLPYLETRIEKELKKSGRLKGKPGFLNYDLSDKSLNDFHHFVFDNFNKWIHKPNGLVNVSEWAENYLSVFSFYNGTNSRTEYLRGELRKQISDNNRFMVKTLKKLSAIFESGNPDLTNAEHLNNYRIKIEQKHNSAVTSIYGIINKIKLYSLTKAFFT